MYHYSVPPVWSGFEYTSSSPSAPHYPYYASQYSPPHGSRSKRHSHRASYGAAKESGWYPPPGYSQNYHEAMPDYTSPPRKHEHVSAGVYHTTGPGFKSRRHFSMPTAQPPHYPSHDAYPTTRSQKRPAFADEVDDAFDSPGSTYDATRGAWTGRHYYEARTTYQDSQPHLHRQSKRKPKPATDYYFYYNQVPVYDETESPKRSRRRASTTSRVPQKPKLNPTPRPTPKATEEDAIREGIPAGYSIKNWDPTEAPIILLGSVFDANSLGKWVYDWTVFHHGASTPMADVAGDLWLLLIKLAGKVKRADDGLQRVRGVDSQEMLESFLESGERLWTRFKKLLKACEHYMWKAAKREGGKGTVMMGRNAGCEFVDSIFGRDRELENTEKLMHSIRLWNMRFDANCEDILRRPSAA